MGILYFYGSPAPRTAAVLRVAEPIYCFEIVIAFLSLLFSPTSSLIRVPYRFFYYHVTGYYISRVAQQPGLLLCSARPNPMLLRGRHCIYYVTFCLSEAPIWVSYGGYCIFPVTPDSPDCCCAPRGRTDATAAVWSSSRFLSSLFPSQSCSPTRGS